VLRSEAHGRELYSYFLGKGPATGSPIDPPAFHTVDEAERLMDETGVVHMNILMFTWAGKYWRDGAYTLPDDVARRAPAEEELRRRIVTRMVDNNEWALGVVTSRPRFSVFVGVNPVVMTEDEMLGEVADKMARGASGVKMVPHDMHIGGDDKRLWPLYDHLSNEQIPLLSEASGRPGAHGNPARFEEPLTAFPRLRVIFAHLGHDPNFGEGADATVAELAHRFEGVHTDLSLRLPDMIRGVYSPEQFVTHLRRIGTDRVLYGTNFGFVDTTNPDPDHRPEDGPQTTWAKRNLESFLSLPLTDDERDDIASENWKRLVKTSERSSR
jgi:predicted TIM-barrel fold metal-dependent hydrolase